MRRSPLILPAGVRAATRPESLVHLLVCLQLELRSPRREMISALMEGHAQSGWLCELETGVEDSKLCENETIELLVGTEATECVCGPQDFTHAALEKGATTSAQDRDW